MKNNQPVLDVLEWNDVRNQVSRLNPSLCKVIDSISPGKKYNIYKVIYPYGAEIVKDGYVHFPSTNRGFISFKELPSAIKEDLDYNSGSNPVTLVLKNKIELFIKLPDRIVPFSIIDSGSVVGLTQVMDKDTTFYPEIGLWGMTAGARSIFLLPKVSESVAFKRIKKKLNLSMEKPATLLEHGPIFKEIAQNLNSNWQVELLFFGKQWFEHLNEKSSLEFDNYLKTIFIQNSSYWRNEYLLRLLYSQIHHTQNVQAAPYCIDTVRHILSLALGLFPGFVPAIDDSIAPVSLIQNIYKEYYGLKQYPPIIMHPEYFNFKLKSRPIYFSLQYNTALELGIKPSGKITTLSILYEISRILQKYIQELTKGKLQLSFSAVNDVVTKVNFEYFHSLVSEYKNILDSSRITEADSTFLQQWENCEFPYKSHFLNGCLRISHKE